MSGLAPNAVSGLRAGGAIGGVQLRRLDMHRDARGSFTEVFHQSWDSGLGPVQWSVVSSTAHVLRGVYVHQRHDEYFCVLQGHATVGLRDLRPGSPTVGIWSLIELYGQDLTALCFPRGIAHGWYFHEASMHLQAVSESYEDYNSDDNLGCHWADPDLEIPWPDRSPIISARSASLGTLRELLSALGA